MTSLPVDSEPVPEPAEEPPESDGDDGEDVSEPPPLVLGADVFGDPAESAELPLHALTIAKHMIRASNNAKTFFDFISRFLLLNIVYVNYAFSADVLERRPACMTDARYILPRTMNGIQL